MRYARVAALDPSGAMRPGWPIEFVRGDVRGILPREDGSVAILACVPPIADGAAEACHLHLLAADGGERPGWPVEEPTATVCVPPLAGPGDSVYLICSGVGERTTLRVIALDPTGTPRQGSPAMFETSVYVPFSPHIASDGTLYFVTQTAEQVVQVHALNAALEERGGWPFVGAGAHSEAYRDVGYVLGPNGTPYIWWYDGNGEPGICVKADRTVIAAVGSDGRALAGWPKTVAGVAVPPVVAADGTVYVASAPGGESTTGAVSIVAISPSGQTKAGWPRTAPSLSGYCPELDLRLAITPDGRAVLMQNTRTATNDQQGVIVVLDAAGAAQSGWLVPGMALDTGCTGCAPGSPPLAPLFAPDGTGYVLMGQGEGAPSTQVIAFDRQGRVLTGWPHLISATGLMHAGIFLGRDERLYVILETQPDGGYEQSTATLRLYVLGTDGRPVSG